jgi:hypothetical protein
MLGTDSHVRPNAEDRTRRGAEAMLLDAPASGENEVLRTLCGLVTHPDRLTRTNAAS